MTQRIPQAQLLERLDEEAGEPTDAGLLNYEKIGFLELGGDNALNIAPLAPFSTR